jgi:hypothetical protein
MLSGTRHLSLCREHIVDCLQAAAGAPKAGGGGGGGGKPSLDQMLTMPLEQMIAMRAKTAAAPKKLPQPVTAPQQQQQQAGKKKMKGKQVRTGAMFERTTCIT